MVEYVNPYCDVCQPVDFGGGVVVDYSQPLEVTTYTDPSAEALQNVDSAKAAFLRGEYDLALNYLDSAISYMPKDPSLHEFRALVLFALGRYSEAALVLNSVLAVNPGWNWTTLIGFYPNVEVYTVQRRALEAYTRQFPSSADGHFVLGYHYMSGGFPDAAAKEFQEVVHTAPNDLVAAQLVKMLTPQETPTPTPNPPAEPRPQQGEVPALDPYALLGTWRATGPEGTTVTLTLNEDSTFTWTVARAGKSTAMSGTYEYDQNTVYFEDPKQGSMSGEIVPGDPNSFTFHIPGSPPGQGEMAFHR